VLSPFRADASSDRQRIDAILEVFGVRPHKDLPHGSINPSGKIQEPPGNGNLMFFRHGRVGEHCRVLMHRGISTRWPGTGADGGSLPAEYDRTGIW
jgi:hypothetical protein